MSQFGSVLYVICVSFICACHSLVDILGGKAYTSRWAPMLQPGRGQHGNNLIVLSMLANISEEKKTSRPKPQDLSIHKTNGYYFVTTGAYVVLSEIDLLPMLLLRNPTPKRFSNVTFFGTSSLVEGK